MRAMHRAKTTQLALKISLKKIFFHQNAAAEKIMHSRYSKASHQLSTIPVDNLVH